LSRGITGALTQGIDSRETERSPIPSL